MGDCDEMIGIGRWCLVTERGMRPCAIVVGDPGGDELTSLIEIKEQAFIEKLIAHTSIKGYDVAILHGLTRRDVVPFDAVILCPAQDGIGGELGAVVRNDHLRLATARD